MTKFLKQSLKATVLFAAFFLLLSSCADLIVPRDYHGQLESLRAKCKAYETNAPRFFLFGMGNRTKYIYKDYLLRNLDNGETMMSFESVVSDSIVPDDYTVVVTMSDSVMRIIEDEDGVRVLGPHSECLLNGTSSKVALPEFNGFVYDRLLKVLHHELLINIRNSKAFPNIFVYDNPFYRDAFMAVLCLEKTGNEKLLADWISSIEQVYDMQNRRAEADNLGELLYLSSVAKINDEVMQKLMDEIKLQTVEDGEYKYLTGITDGAPNAEYATQILKLALAKNKMADDYTSSPTQDRYNDLCWFALDNYREQRYPFWNLFIPHGDEESYPYPYLQWARAHYYDDYEAPMSSTDYPLSWEAIASQAHYERMEIISNEAVRQKISYPHLWAAAEMFLKLYQYKR